MTKNKMTILMLAAALLAPTASLWASAGDAGTQGPAGSTTGTPAPKVKKHHGGHHHKKPTTPSTTNTK